MVGVDSDENFIGITVFNFSNKFTALVEDNFAVPSPLLFRPRDIKISEEIKLDLNFIRVDDPQFLCRNGTRLGPKFKALADVRFGLK